MKVPRTTRKDTLANNQWTDDTVSSNHGFNLVRTNTLCFPRLGESLSPRLIQYPGYIFPIPSAVYLPFGSTSREKSLHVSKPHNRRLCQAPSL